jgi:hypothetical protein
MPITYYPTYKNSSGNVGIGNINPSYRLDVKATTTNGSTVFIIRNANDSNNVAFYDNGTVSAGSDFRAPIFYDSNDTTYYVDPAGTSRVNTLYVANVLADSASVNGRILLYGNLHIDAYGANDIYCNYYSGRRFRTYKGVGTGAETFRADTDGLIYAFQEFRTPIIYDYDNTGYYLDPASTSNLNALVVAASGRVGGAASRSNSGLTVGFNNSTTFAANTDVGDAVRTVSIVNENSTTNVMSVLGFRINPNGGTSNAMMDIKYVQTGITNTSALHYTFNHGGSFLDRFSILSSGNVGIGAIAPDTNLQVVGHVHVGNQTTFENVGGWNKTIYLDGLVHSRLRILGSAYASGKNSSTETYLWVDNSVAPYSGLATNAGSFQISAGFTTMLNSARSPIFYDSDNTAYYIDAASASSLNTLTMAGIITTVSNGTAINFSGQSDSFGYNATAGQGTYIKGTGGTYIYGGGVFYDGSAIRTLLHSNNYSGYSTFSGSVTAQYGSFATPSLIMGDAQYGFYVVSGNVYYKSASGGVHYWRNIANNANTMSLDNSGTLNLAADVRAPIFYDSADTNYYGDFASTSVLNRLNYQQLRRNFGSSTYSGPPSGSNNVKTFSGVLVAGSANSSTNSYTVIETNVPQGSYQMGGFTINWFENYSSTNGKTKIEIAGYWNPTSNGGFIGFEFTTTNTNIQPTIQVGSNASGNTVFILSHFSSNYPVIVARDLWFGYNATDAEWGTGWTMTNTNSIAAYSNIVSAVCRTGPTLTGSGASGTWGISVTGSSASCTGNAATATTLANARTLTIGSTGKTFNGSADVSWSTTEIVGYTPAYGNAAYQSKSLDTISTPGLYQYDGGFGGTKPPDNSPNYRTIEIGSSARFSQVAMPWNSDGYYFRRYDGTSFSTWRTVLHDGNYNSYAPTLTGTGASGTWAINSQGIYAAGAAYIKSTSTGTSYTSHIQVREADGGVSSTNEIYAPALGFHWAGVVASNILMESSGRIAIRNNPGSSYENFIANIVYGNSSVQTPILYDSNDTTYYIDPASFSLTSSIGIGGLTSSNNVQMYDSYVDASSSYLQSPPLIIRKDNSATGAIDQAPVGLFIYNLNGTNNTWTKLSMGNREATGAGNTVSIAGLAAQKTAGTANAWATGNLHFWTKAGATQITNMIAYSSGYVESAYSFRAPIFYDSNNTSYYVDPASTSNLNNLTVAGTMTFGSLAYVTESRRSKNSSNVDIETVTGLVSPSGPTFLEIRGFCPPTMYRTTGDRPAPYGLGFGNGSESGGIMPIGAGDNLQEIMLYGANSGPTTFTFKRQIWEGSNQDPSYSNYYGSSVFSINTGTGAVTASTDIRAPIFYDSANTAYYCDPNGVSSLYGVAIRGDQASTNTNNQIFFWDAGNTTTSAIGFKSNGGAFTNPTGNGDGYNTYFTMDTSGRGWVFRRGTGGSDFTSAYTAGWILNNGVWQASASMRAPIFYDSDNTAYYIDAASTSVLNGLNVVDANLELYKSQTVDMSNTTTYSTSNYYPVTISVPTEGCIIQIQNNLNSNVPSWSTHGSGFTLNLRWRTNGSGWGTTAVRRYIEQYHERFANQTICGGITQMTNSSTEVVWLRGGGQYLFKFSRNLSATAQSSTYTVNSQSVSPTSTAQNGIWDSYSGGWTIYNDITYSTTSMSSPIYYDYNNSAYYVDPSSTSNLVGLTVANTITGSISGNAATVTNGMYLSGDQNILGIKYFTSNKGSTSTVGANNSYVLEAYSSDAGAAGMSFHRGGYYAVNMGLDPDNIMRIGGWSASSNRWELDMSGNNWVASSFRAPVFYDSNNTTYYVDPASTSNLVGLTVTNTITGSISGNAATATTTDNINGRAFLNRDSGNGLGQDSYNSNGVGYVTGISLYSQTDGGMYASAYSTSWIHQIYGDFRTGQIAIRGKNSGTWQSWRFVLDSSNYTSYSPSLTGTGASGSWGISVTGSSASCTGNAATVTNGLTTSNYSSYSSFSGTVYGTAFYSSSDVNYYLQPTNLSNLWTVRANNFYANQVSVTATASTTINTIYNVTQLTLSASITTLTFSGIQSSTIATMWTVVVLGQGTSYSITWPAAVKWPGGTAPTLTTTLNKRDIYQFLTYDGGTTIYAIIVGQNL